MFHHKIMQAWQTFKLGFKKKYEYTLFWICSFITVCVRYWMFKHSLNNLQELFTRREYHERLKQSHWNQTYLLILQSTDPLRNYSSSVLRNWECCHSNVKCLCSATTVGWSSTGTLLERLKLAVWCININEGVLRTGYFFGTNRWSGIAEWCCQAGGMLWWAPG